MTKSSDAEITTRIQQAGARAAAEAQARRDRRATAPESPEEWGGQKGPEPTRYGDWEKKGIVSDF